MALIRDSKCQRVEKRILIYSTYFIVWRFHFGLRNSCCLPVREPSSRGEEEKREKREKREKPRLDRDEDGPPRRIVLVSSLASKSNRPPFFNNNANHVHRPCVHEAGVSILSGVENARLMQVRANKTIAR